MRSRSILVIAAGSSGLGLFLLARRSSGLANCLCGPLLLLSTLFFLFFLFTLSLVVFFGIKLLLFSLTLSLFVLSVTICSRAVLAGSFGVRGCF